jgi:hypothetical protein
MSSPFCVEEFSGIELKNQPYDFSYTIGDEFVEIVIDVNNDDISDLSSVLEKRKFGIAFDQTTFDDERYGQHIATDFFEKNIGHLDKRDLNK